MADKRKGYSPEVARMAIEAYKAKRAHSIREIASASHINSVLHPAVLALENIWVNQIH